MARVYEMDGIVPVIDPTAFVHPDAVLIGDVIIGPRCYIGPMASLRGDFGRVTVEAGANVQDSCVLHCFPGRDVIVRQDGHVGHGAVLHGCDVGRQALIGIHAVIMDGAVIGERAFVAANSFVKAEDQIPEAHLAAGTPAVVVRPLTDQEMAWKANGTVVYQDLAERSLASLRPATALAAVEPDRPRMASGSSTSVPLRDYRRAT